MTTRPEFGPAAGVRLRELIEWYRALGPEPADEAAEQLRGLVAWGMAPSPADPPARLQ